MSTKHNKKRTSSTNPNHGQTDELETIAKKMDEICRRRLPDGVIRSGILKGFEAEIRQEALIMSVGGFLQQNADYLDARKKHDVDAIQDSMEKCAAITLRVCKTRMASRLSRSHGSDVLLTESNGGACHHPSQLPPAEWPSDLKAGVIMQAVGKAVHAGDLSVANASIMSMVCEHGMPVVEVALVWKITRSAVYQQIHRVRRVIPEIIDQIDTYLM